MILDAVRSLETHPTAEEVFFRVHETDAKISKATVYRVLHQLSRNGEISGIDIVPDAGRYDKRTDKHHHMLCEVCGSVFDAPVAYCEDEDRKLEELTGFRIRRHEVIFRGICETCLKEIERGETNGSL